jgi:septal ring factor EnvC (AmiA/AmiB activator)
MSKVKGILVLLVALFWLQTGSAQNDKRQNLEARKIRLMDEIELANRILSETQKDRKNSIGTIETVQQKIKLRQKLIRTLDREVQLMDEDELDMQAHVDTIRVGIERQKQEYAHMIRQANKSRKNSSRLMFILSSQDFNQALRRIEYLKQYSSYRQQKIKEIQAEEVILAAEMERLRVQKIRKNAVRGQLAAESKKLGSEKLSQEEAIKTFRAMEQDLETKLKKKLKEAQVIELQIQKIIFEEIKRAKDRAARKALEDRAMNLGLIRGRDFTSNTTSESIETQIEAAEKARAAANQPAIAKPETYELTPEARSIAANFEANQKRLPWPVTRGLVTSNFGPQRHPIVKSVIIDNRGVDIATEGNAPIKAIFEGEVSRIYRMPNGQLVVIVNHGSYFSVYQGIIAVQVNNGDKVKKGDVIGSAYTNPVTSETKLHFEIWKDTNAVNPLLWLSGR